MKKTTPESSSRAQEHQSMSPAEPSTLSRAAIIVAIAMVLPAIGMIVGGFTYGRPRVGYVGIALMVVLGIAYFLILNKLLRISHSEPG